MAGLFASAVITGSDRIMKSPASETSTRLPAKIGHELLCFAIAGIFCVFEFLVLISEFRVKKLFRARHATGELPSNPK